MFLSLFLTRLFVGGVCPITSLFVLLGSARKVQALQLLIHKAAQGGSHWDSLPLSEFSIMMHDLKNAAINFEKITDR